MKFFTRELFDEFQQIAKREFELDDIMSQRLNDYAAKLEKIEKRLPPGAKTLAVAGLRDSLITGFSRPSRDQVVMEIDGEQSEGFGRRGRLVFEGVRKFIGPKEIEGRGWLFEEVFHNQHGGLDLSVLLTEGEITLTADDVIIEDIDGEDSITGVEGARGRNADDPDGEDFENEYLKILEYHTCKANQKPSSQKIIKIEDTKGDFWILRRYFISGESEYIEDDFTEIDEFEIRIKHCPFCGEQLT